MLPPPEGRVLEAARRQAQRLAGDPNHTVAAAAMDITGAIFTAVNDFHFTGGPCAELVVLGVAAASGAAPLATVVAVGDGGRGVLPPCGRCRQVLLDQQPDCMVVVPSEDGPIAVPVRHLLPHPFEHPDARPDRFLRFDPRYHDAVVAGRKTATTRFDDPATLGPAFLVFEFDDRYRVLRAVVDAVESKRFDGITDEDARLEGVPTADALRHGLRGHYPGIRDEGRVDVVRFHLDERAATPGRGLTAGR